ncbi:MAG: DUF1631 domain-containing protein [Pseudomonadales bacterium]|nr:DUF1631 domain-containing protein [Pseudomonadales bacterium]
MKEHLDKVKFATTRSLTRLVIKALDDARLQIEAQAMRFVGAKLPPIAEESPGIAERFTQNLHNYFDELTTLVVKDSEIEPDNYDNLSLVDHDYLEAMIAMEGMVKQMRDREYKGAKSLLTRLETMFPNIRINETNNPLDPEQIGDCFNEAIRPLGLKAHYLLTIYREFNKTVFANYESILEEANDVLVELGVLPNLDITAEERERRKTQRAQARAQLEAELKAKQEAEAQEQANRGKPPQAAPAPTEAAAAVAAAPAAAPSRPASASQTPTAGPSQADMFAMMQSLVKNLAERQVGNELLTVIPGAEADNDPAARQVQQQQIMTMLSDIQSRVSSDVDPRTVGETDSSVSQIGQTISEDLQTSQASIDRASGDVINLVTMLYQAIWNDKGLPTVMKELIGRTQISIMKVALGDTAFFEDENHPGRALLNELALAGVAWTETDDLDNDPGYGMVRDVVSQLMAAEQPERELLQSLTDQLRAFTSSQAGTDASLEKRVHSAENLGANMDDVHAYVSQKVNERVLKGYLDPAIRNLLDTHLHNFLVKLVLKEGPEGKSWKAVMNTIDVLLWTVQADKQAGDRDRFNRINPRLLDNLQKALEIGGASKTKITKAMRQLKQIQEYTFHKAEVESQESPTGVSPLARKEPPLLPREDPYLRRVEKMPLGTWIEFRNTLGQTVRCALVSKIDSIDKLFFADKQGKKVAELTRNRLAREMKLGTVKVVSEGALVNRAMQKVINDLKETAKAESKSDKGVATG